MTFSYLLNYGCKKGQMIATANMIESSSFHQTAQQIDEEMEQIKKAQADPKCFGPLYTTHYKRIVSYVYHRVESKEDAYEITAQVFYKALDNLSKYKSQGLPFASWLFRIASNEVNQVFRKNKTNRVVSIDDEGLVQLKGEVEDNLNDEHDAQLYSALQTLDESEMEIIDMRYFEKRSFKEICDITGINESACKMRVYRILEKLRMKLKK